MGPTSALAVFLFVFLVVPTTYGYDLFNPGTACLGHNYTSPPASNERLQAEEDQAYSRIRTVLLTHKAKVFDDSKKHTTSVLHPELDELARHVACKLPHHYSP